MNKALRAIRAQILVDKENLFKTIKKMTQIKIKIIFQKQLYNRFEHLIKNLNFAINIFNIFFIE